MLFGLAKQEDLKAVGDKMEAKLYHITESLLNCGLLEWRPSFLPFHKRLAVAVDLKRLERKVDLLLDHLGLELVAHDAAPVHLSLEPKQEDA